MKVADNERQNNR